MHARLLMDRRDGDRKGLERASTLRSDPQIPVDVFIDDLSCGGCRISGDMRLAVDDRVTIGLPGIGARPAHVIWAETGSAGLVFQQRLTEGHVDIAQGTNTLIEGYFGLSAMSGTVAPAQPDSDRLPKSWRLAIIAATAIVTWALTLAAIWAVTRLF